MVFKDENFVLLSFIRMEDMFPHPFYISKHPFRKSNTDGTSFRL